MKSYCLSDSIINSSEALLFMDEITFTKEPDILVKWHTELNTVLVNEMYEKFNCDEENKAERSFNDVIPKAKISKYSRLIFYYTQVLFKIEYSDVMNHFVTIDVYVCNGFPSDLAKEMLLTDALPIAIFMKTGLFFIHAACVELDGKYIALLGDGGSGKSTLVSFLYSKGHKVLSDDMICISIDGAMKTTSYINYMRLWNDSYNNFGKINIGTTYNGKHLLKINKSFDDWVEVNICCWLNRGGLKTEIVPLNAMEGYIKLISSLIMGFSYKKSELELIRNRLIYISKTNSLFVFNYCDGYDKLNKIIPV